MIRKALFKNADDRYNYVEHVKQTNLHPGRNCHYKSGRYHYEWDQQNRHERPIQISNPTKHVKCYAELSVQDTLPDQTMKHKFIAEPMSALKKVVKHRQIISKRQMILFSHVHHQLHSHICKKQVMTEVIS